MVGHGAADLIQSLESTHWQSYPSKLPEQVLGIEGADGNAYVVGMEVCKVLGYAEPSNALKGHCKYPILYKPTESMGLGLTPEV